VTLAGSVFHARAPVTGNARSPSEDRHVAGTTTSVLEAERSRHIWGTMLEAYHKVHLKPKSITELKEVLQVIWDLRQSATGTDQQGC